MKLLPSLLAGVVLRAPDGLLPEASIQGPTDSSRTELTALRTSPSAHLGSSWRCVLQLAHFEAQFEPLLSRFSPANFTRICAWSENQWPWLAAEHNNPAPYLFVRKGTPAESLLLSLSTYERALVTLRVREVLLGEPWIEIESAYSAEPSIGEGSVLHAARAQELIAEGRYDLARSELERALASPMPGPAQAALNAERDALEAGRGTETSRERRAPYPVEAQVYHLELGPKNLPRRQDDPKSGER